MILSSVTNIGVCYLVIDRPQRKMPDIEIDLKDCAVPAAVVMSCLRGVQSHVSSPDYKQGAFFTQGTMESVRDAIASSRNFMSCAGFDPWEGLTIGKRSSFVQKYSSAFDAYLSRKKSEATKQLHSANRQPRHVQFSDSGGSGKSSACNSPRVVLPSSLFAVASSESGSEVGSSKQRSYTDESALAAILGQKKEAKPTSKESAVRKEASPKLVVKDSAKSQKRDATKSPKPSRKRPGSKSELD